MHTLPNFFRADASEYAAFLDTLRVGPVSSADADTLAQILTQLDPKGNTWTSVNGEGYSLANSQVLYAGENKTILPTNPKFKKVVGVSVSNCQETGSRVYLHYN